MFGIRSSGRGIYPIGHRVSSGNQPNDVALAFEDDPETLQPEVRAPIGCGIPKGGHSGKVA